MNEPKEMQATFGPPREDGTGRLLTPPQVAAFLQVKFPRVYEMVKAKRLRAVKVGRQLRFRPRDLEVFLERSATERW